MRTYTIYPIPYEMRGSEYLALLYSHIKGETGKDVYRIRRFSWKELFFTNPANNERRVVHIHWETNIYGSEFLLLSLIRMAYRYPGLMLLKLRGVKIIWTIHNLRAHDYPHPIIDRIGRSLMWHVTDAAIIQQKNFYMTELLKPRRISLFHIPHPNFINVFGPIWTGDKHELRRKYGLPEGEKILLAFGSVRPYKELPLLIQSVSQARKLSAKVVLWIAGKASEDYKKEILERVKGDSGVILRLGFVDNNDVPEIFAATDYSILYYSDSSLNSGPLLLSLSYGVPVITRDMPASEIIRTGLNGFVFKTSEELVQLLKSLETVPNFDSNVIMGSSGPDWPTIACEHRSAYAKLWKNNT